MTIDSSLFVDVADAIGLGNPAIVEKDYYVVQLLHLISSIDLEYHQIVFSGGTALAKSTVKTYRMSEDIDLKLIPKQSFSHQSSQNARRSSRKDVKNLIESLIESCALFSIEGTPTISDKYRYFAFDIRYPQQYQQIPCLRPFIKLEFIESDLLSKPETRSIQSIFAEVTQSGIEIDEFPCSAIIDTQAEKLLSMIRRTASVARNNERTDDETLIRHIYDTYHIQLTQPSSTDLLSSLVAKAIKIDVERYGNQHQRMIQAPIDELRYGLQRLIDDSKFSERYNNYVSPMVYAENPVSWEDALTVFSTLTNQVLDHIEANSLMI